jgi:hypothetical protein
MTQHIRDLDNQNIKAIISNYENSFAEVGHAIQGLKGKPLIEALKRKRVEIGPYPHVTLFEAANRIMSDLVILHGVKCLLGADSFPFDSYKVELGHENNNDFDIIANNGSETLVGEAFNVASSFFPVKKNAALKKLRTKSQSPTYQILMFNHDAVKDSYRPKPRTGEYLVFVDITESVSRIVPNNSFKPKPLRGSA